MADTVLAFPKRKAPVPAQHGTGFKLPGPPLPPPGDVVYSTYESGSAAPAVIEIDKLYPEERESRSKVVKVLGLLGDAVSLLEMARLSARQNNESDADRYSQRFQALLAPLFEHRAIGDGFVSAINSLHFAFINQHGKPLTLEQLTTVLRVMKELRNGPFVTFEQSLRWVEEFEQHELKVDPPVLADFIEEPEIADSASE